MSYSHPIIGFLTVRVEAFDEQAVIEVFKCSLNIRRPFNGPGIDSGNDETFSNSSVGKFSFCQGSDLGSAVDLKCRGDSKRNS